MILVTYRRSTGIWLLMDVWVTYRELGPLKEALKGLMNWGKQGLSEGEGGSFNSDEDNLGWLGSLIISGHQFILGQWLLEPLFSQLK